MLLPSIIGAKLVNSDKSKTTSNATQNIATEIANKTSKAMNPDKKNTSIIKNQVSDANANDNSTEIYLNAEVCTNSCFSSTY